MELDVLKEQLAFLERVYDGDAEYIDETEVIVPDYMPDIMRVIETGGCVCIKDKAISNNSITVTGDVLYYVLYMPEESETIKSIRCKNNFKYTFEGIGTTSEDKAIIQADLIHSDARPVNSRKISIKGAVSLTVCAYSNTELEVTTGIKTEGDFEVKKNKAPIFFANCITSKGTVLSEELEIPQGNPPIVDLLFSTVSIFEKDIKTVSNRIIVKGTALINTLYISDEATCCIQSMEHELPFSQILEGGNIDENSSVCLNMNVSSFNTSVKNKSNSDNNAIGVDLGINIDATAYMCKEVEILTDAFSPGYMLEMSPKEVNIERLIEDARIPVTVKEALTVDSNMPPIGKIVRVSAKPYIASNVISDGSVTMNGALEVCAVYTDQTDGTSLNTLQRTIPVTLSRNIIAGLENIKSDVSIIVSSISYNINMSGELELRAVCDICFKITEEEHLATMTSIKATEKNEKNPPSIVLYYPNKGENLWDICKCHSVKISDLKAANNIKDEMICDGKMLFIARK